MSKIIQQISKRLKLTASLLLFTASFTLLAIPNRAGATSGSVILALTNTQRSGTGVASLTWSDALASSAQIKADDLCAKGYWAHTSPDGTEPWTIMERVGYKYTIAGENLAKGFTTDDGVMAGWMASPGHRANILKSEFTELGVALSSCVFEGVQTTIVTAHYGSRYQQPRQIAKPDNTAVQVITQQPKTRVTPVATTQPTETPKATQTRVLNESATQQPQKPKKNIFSEIWTLQLAFNTNLFRL